MCFIQGISKCNANPLAGVNCDAISGQGIHVTAYTNPTEPTLSPRPAVGAVLKIRPKSPVSNVDSISLTSHAVIFHSGK